MEGRASIVAGESVELSAPRRDEFVARWSLFNDPMLAMMLGSPVLAHGVHTRTMPPVSAEYREALSHYVSREQFSQWREANAARADQQYYSMLNALQRISARLEK